MSNAAIRKHFGRLSQIGCIACRRLDGSYTAPEIHHIAQGTGLRSDWATVPLCPEHHRGAFSIHGSMDSFIKVLRVPGESEWGLMVWTAEDLARFGQ